MAVLFECKTFSDERGCLTVVDKELPFPVARVFYIYDIKGRRGEHRHLSCRHVLISVTGFCRVVVENPGKKEIYQLDTPEKCLLLEPEDWHAMDQFSDNCVLLALASEPYSPDETIREKLT